MNDFCVCIYDVIVASLTGGRERCALTFPLTSLWIFSGQSKR